jgi:hypothetical protein
VWLTLRISKRLSQISLVPLGAVIITTVLCLGWATEWVATQQPVTLTAGSAIVGKISTVDSGGTDATDTTAHAVKVSIVANSAGSTTDTEDASVASGQSSLALTIPLTYLYNGTAWIRPTADPCQTEAKVYTPISQATGTKLITGTSSKKTYICGVTVVTADAENISFVSGTGSVCGTNTAAVIGSTTAAAGPNLAANGGFVLNNGDRAWAITAVNADDLCLFQSASGRIAGVLVSVVR